LIAERLIADWGSRIAEYPIAERLIADWGLGIAEWKVSFFVFLCCSD